MDKTDELVRALIETDSDELDRLLGEIGVSNLSDGDILRIIRKANDTVRAMLTEEELEELDGKDPVEIIVRRLLPEECAVLQAFPEDWCNIGETYQTPEGKTLKASDTPKYKAYGNSICCNWWWILFQRFRKRLAPDRTVNGEPMTLGSLFDGIGGFPLTFEENFGEGSARWGSEIEPFPMAVTKFHFPESTCSWKDVYDALPEKDFTEVAFTVGGNEISGRQLLGYWDETLGAFAGNDGGYYDDLEVGSWREAR